MTTWIKRVSIIAASTAILGTTIGIGAASAHAALAGQNPADGAQIASAPEEVVLTFNQDIQPAFATLNVVGPDGTQWGRSEPAVNERDMSVDIDGLGDAGQYTVAFRVVSADGHPIDGSYNFTLTQRAQPAPAAAAATMPGLSPNAQPTSVTATPKASNTVKSDRDQGFPAWIAIVGVVVVLAGGVAFMLRKRPER